MDLCVCVCVCDKKENRNGTTSNANRHQFKTGGLWQLEIPEWINIQHNDVFHFFFLSLLHLSVTPCSLTASDCGRH